MIVSAKAEAVDNKIINHRTGLALYSLGIALSTTNLNGKD